MADVVIVGGGQAGLAASVCLSRLGIDNVVLEKGEIGEAWRSQRWDSFRMNTPNWTLNLPGQDYGGSDPDGFMSRLDFIDLLERYANRFGVPVRSSVEANRAASVGTGWRLETTAGPMTARALVMATSTYQTANVPLCAGELSRSILSMSAADYRSPAGLPEGKVLVVGSAQSGMQIVEDLQNAGRDVLLSVGQAGRVPRRYRGRDLNYWYDRIGLMDRRVADLDDPGLRFGGQPQIAAGHTVSLQKLHREGVRLLGRVAGIAGPMLYLTRDLRETVAAADAHSDTFCRNVDAFIAANGLSVPADEGDDPIHTPLEDLSELAEPEALDLAVAGVTTVIWATGFRFDYSWIDADVTDGFGYPVTARGETAAPGLYFLGLNFLYTRRSGIVYGVGPDAEHVAARIKVYLGG